MKAETIEALGRELGLVLGQLNAPSDDASSWDAPPEVARLRFDTQRLARCFRLFEARPEPRGSAVRKLDFPTLLCLAIRPAGRECRRRQCFLRLDLGGARGANIVAEQSVDAVLCVVEDAVHHGATWIDVTATMHAPQLVVTVRTDADLTASCLGVTMLNQLAPGWGSMLRLCSFALEPGGVFARFEAETAKQEEELTSQSQREVFRDREPRAV